jgi:hypothetical protein
MQPIQIQYPNGKEASFLAPSKFEDLTTDQYVGAIHLMKAAEQNASMQWLLVPLLIKADLNTLRELSEAHRVQILMTLDFLFDQSQLPSKWMIPKISLNILKGSRTLYGPGDVLKYLTFGEFIAAETKLESYERLQSNLTALNQFCGILYRNTDSSRKKLSDKRIEYVEGMVELCGRNFEKVPDHLKAAIVLNYTGAKAILPKLYKNVFPPDLQNDKQGSKTQKKSSSLTWLNMLVNMAERDVTKIKSIESAPMHTVLKVLDDTIAHNDEMKREMEKVRRK